MSTSEELKNFKDHIDWVVKGAFFVWKYKYVIPFVGSIWLLFGATIIKLSVPYVAPFVRPVIKTQWINMVQPYDSALISIDERLKGLEQ